MVKNIIGEYIESGYKGSQEHISDEVYQKVLDAIVVTCVDVIVIFEGNVLLAKRDQFPQKDWWMFGGRMRAGESFSASARRLFVNESKLDIAEDRFKYLSIFAAAWNKRAHKPVNNGTHTVSIVMWLEINEREYQEMKINEEYSDLNLVSLRELMSDESYHPALRQCAEELNEVILKV